MKLIISLLLFFTVAFPQPLMAAEQRVIHVLVALCDNETQGIVPVPASIGNGDDPRNNLYWGAMYGVSTHMKKQKNWKLEAKIDNPTDKIYERLIFRSAYGNDYLIADAYAGKYIRQSIDDLFSFASGQRKVAVEYKEGELSGGADADLLVFMGHNGLMDFSLDTYPVAVSGDNNFLQLPPKSSPILYDGKKREVAVFSCHSERYFKELLSQSGATPLVLTRDFMAPEGYILAALADSWVKNEKPEQIREKVAAAYQQYQKCGLKAARRMFGAPPAAK